jgi:hypothetical protein
MTTANGALVVRKGNYLIKGFYFKGAISMVVRQDPRISVNKLGEYMTATPIRRKRIIQDQKKPSDFIVTRYREAYEAIISFLEDEVHDESIIHRAVDELTNKQTTSEFQEQDRDLSIESLWSFLDLIDDLDFENIQIGSSEEYPDYMDIAEVSVSIHPDLIVKSQQTGKEEKLGVLKLYIVKSYPLNEESGAYIGSLLHNYGTQNIDEQRIHHGLCLVLDVFNKRIFNAPRTYVRRMRDIEAACEEIARAWPTI